MNVLFLGTAAAEGFPAPFCGCKSCGRARASGGKNLRLSSGGVLINGELMIDMPADITAMTQKFKLNLTGLKYVAVTHTHNDHFSPGFLNYNLPKYSVESQPVIILGSPPAEAAFNKFNFEKRDFLEFKLIKPYSPVILNGCSVTALRANHDTEHSFLYLIEYGGGTYLHATDTAYPHEDFFEYLKDKKVNIAAFDGTMGTRETTHPRHLNFNEAGEIAKRLKAQGTFSAATKIFCTHFSHYINMTHAEINAYLKKFGIKAAYDGLNIRL